MKKNLIFALTLCLSVLISCEQQSIFDQLTKETQTNIITREDGPACDLTTVPLYIPPATTIQGNTLDLSTALPVTVSTDYEAANGTNISIKSISYSVNDAPLTANPSFSYTENDQYKLRIGVAYAIGQNTYEEVFSLLFSVTNAKELTWGDTNWCEYEVQAVDFRSGTMSYILP